MTHDYAVIAGGCFWCTEAIFKMVIGVQTVESGYTGGFLPNPTYEEVKTGETGHAEAIRIDFDPAQISYSELLDISFATHDPTQLNRQGNDVGTQYRSAIFYTNNEQKKEAKKAIWRAQSDYSNPIVTTIEPLNIWYPAEEYHQNYWQDKGKQDPYCSTMIPPKLQKLLKHYALKKKL